MMDTVKPATSDEVGAPRGSTLPHAVIDAYPCGIIALDDRGIVRAANPAAAALVGFPPGEVDGRALALILAAAVTREGLAVPPTLWPWLEHNMPRPLTVGYTPAGRARRWLELTAAFVPGDLTAVSVVDVTPYIDGERRLERQALHDPLTGLPNRALFADRLTQALRAARREQSVAAILMMDLNGFKDVNDSFGHDIGDRLLHAVAARFRERLRTSDTLARLGGDEFAAILAGTDEEGARLVARSLTDALDTPIVLEGEPVPPLRPATSVGIALYPAHGTDAETILRHADAAMYTAKRGQRGPVVYVDGTDMAQAAHLSLVAALQDAVRAGELTLHYQPKLGLADAKTRAVEALLRWTSPIHGAVEPSVFIPIAEENGLIAEISRWVLDTALAQCAAWQADGLDLRVDINVAAALLHDPALPEVVDAALTRHGVPTRQFGVEVTETAVLTDQARAVGALHALAARGVHISVDDYGTGYSSLAQLKKLPIHELKIDRGLVQALGHDATDRAIVQAAVALGHALGLEVVAEGVEDAAAWSSLRAFGCDTAQGYYMTRPMAADAVAAWVRTQWRPRRQRRLFRQPSAGA